MLLTDDPGLWERAWSYKDHGKSHALAHGRSPTSGYRWLHESFGTNWRMTELQAAIGRVQLRKLGRWVDHRRRNAARLAERLGAHPALRIPRPPAHVGHAWYKFYAFLRPERLGTGWDRDRVLNAMLARGVPCFNGSCSEMYLEKAFARAGLAPPSRLPVARELGETSLMFPVDPTLGEPEMDAIARAVTAVLDEAAG